MTQHSTGLKDKFQQSLNSDYKLEEKDVGNNNFTEWHRTKIDEYNVDWDTLFLALRNI
jgi:hypothetical protein